jgi:hypothetical protein
MRLLSLARTRKRTSEGHKLAIEEGALRGKVHASPVHLQATRS